jgi:predicted nucleotidyltransferase
MLTFVDSGFFLLYIRDVKRNMIKKAAINDIVAKIADTAKPRRIILFGSYAQEKADENSDLDLLVVVDETDLPKHKRARAIRKRLWGLTDIPKDIVVYTQSEIDEWKGVKSSFISSVLEHGKVLYEN